MTEKKDWRQENAKRTLNYFHREIDEWFGDHKELAKRRLAIMFLRNSDLAKEYLMKEFMKHYNIVPGKSVIVNRPSGYEEFKDLVGCQIIAREKDEEISKLKAENKKLRKALINVESTMTEVNKVIDAVNSKVDRERKAIFEKIEKFPNHIWDLLEGYANDSGMRALTAARNMIKEEIEELKKAIG